MAEMRAAIGAPHFSAPHAVGIVFMRCHSGFCCRVSEARPACPQIEFRIGAEQRRATDDAAIHAVALVLVIRMTEGPLGAVLLRHMELLGGKLLA